MIEMVSSGQPEIAHSAGETHVSPEQIDIRLDRLQRLTDEELETLSPLVLADSGALWSAAMSKPTRADRPSDEQRRLAEHLGSICRTRRKSLKLSQKAVAAQIGVSRGFYSRMEQGAALPGVKTLAALAITLKISPDRLLGIRPGSASSSQDAANSEVEELALRLSQASPETLRVVTVVLRELRAIERKRRK